MKYNIHRQYPSTGYCAVSYTHLSYLLFFLVYLSFFLCTVMYLSSRLLSAWKDRSPAHKYTGENLFFYGQVLSKLRSASKSMTLISLTPVSYTHLVRKAIARNFGRPVSIIDGSEGTARQLRRQLEAASLLTDRTGFGTVTFQNSRPDKLAMSQTLFQMKY